VPAAQRLERMEEIVARERANGRPPEP
jgi:hypothetical protein